MSSKAISPLLSQLLPSSQSEAAKEQAKARQAQLQVELAGLQHQFKQVEIAAGLENQLTTLAMQFLLSGAEASAASSQAVNVLFNGLLEQHSKQQQTAQAEFNTFILSAWSDRLKHRQRLEEIAATGDVQEKLKHLDLEAIRLQAEPEAAAKARIDDIEAAWKLSE